MEFAAAIRQARLDRGLSQKDVADHLHVSQPAVSAWEMGVAFPVVPLLAPLADLLGVDPEMLLRLAADKKPRGEVTVA